MVSRNHRWPVRFAATRLERLHTTQLSYTSRTTDSLLPDLRDCTQHSSPTLAEPLAMHWCLQWILPTDQDGHFFVETDSEVTVKCLHGHIRIAAIKNIILDCSDILSKRCTCGVAHMMGTFDTLRRGFKLKLLHFSTLSVRELCF
ncbi:hypothetical protein L195_g011287 [Trifolium pratense]|uniref:Uncharacterized protein n=1 Tax=Trifolium pratense TaxID=57577 RepID=A0A2K3PH37_TRIPR|nr:hypothetical protein L195_g011287 [Trifolium pratense]